MVDIPVDWYSQARRRQADSRRRHNAIQDQCRPSPNSPLNREIHPNEKRGVHVGCHAGCLSNSELSRHDNIITPTKPTSFVDPGIPSTLRPRVCRRVRVQVSAA